LSSIQTSNAQSSSRLECCAADSTLLNAGLELTASSSKSYKKVGDDVCENDRIKYRIESILSLCSLFKHEAFVDIF